VGEEDAAVGQGGSGGVEKTSGTQRSTVAGSWSCGAQSGVTVLW